MMERDDEPAQMRYATALAEWGDAGGYEAEVLFDACTDRRPRRPLRALPVARGRTLSGGEQKRLVLEALLRGRDEVLLLDEPDNYLDVPGKIWLEEQLAATPKTVLLVSHDRELLARARERIITVEDRHVWVHGGGFATYAQARRDRIERLDELRRRWDEEHEKLRQLMLMYKQKASYNADMASRYQAAVTRLRKFEEAGPPELAPRDQNVKMRLRGGRTGKRAVICEQLELTGLMRPFDLEVWYAERVAVLGSNGSGKSHFLRLLAGDDVVHEGVARLGARVVPGMFAQTHARPDLASRTPVEIVMTEHAMLINEAMSALSRGTSCTSARGSRSAPCRAVSRPGCRSCCWSWPGPRCCCSTSPPTTWTWPARRRCSRAWSRTRARCSRSRTTGGSRKSFDRFLVFGADGGVYESASPVWDETRVQRPR